MAEQQQMVLFIRQLLASLIRELENDNDQSDHLDSVTIYDQLVNNERKLASDRF